VATGGVVVVGVAVLLLLVSPVVWRSMIGSARTYSALLGVLRLTSAVNGVLALAALAGAVTAAVALAAALYRARRERSTQAGAARPEAAAGWGPVWGMVGGLLAVVAVLAGVLALGGGPRSRSLAVLAGGDGDTVDPAVRSAFERLYDPPPLGVTVLGVVLLVAAGVLVVALVRRLGRAAA
jgi:hypothetical protein